MHPTERGFATKLTELLLAELDREAVGIRKTLERVPEGKNDWKPHEKSMPLGSLATIVATIPAWLEMVVNMDEVDINPLEGRSSNHSHGRRGTICWSSSRTA
jgi:hypothetical protein